jgi:hypothetical protein
MESLRNDNKKWHKLNNNEVLILKNMVVNNFSKKNKSLWMLGKWLKKIWKQAMKEVKKLENGIQAENAKQILFYYKFGSTNKRKKRN